ncbi:methylated-DNA--[protein]-cysteine S-methyltransferase [Haliea sp. E1-2-M8]|uniref:methylated-DNA--[protein]-cysteine S-methyltransferase n=1 Tax=Haliea sp. E1-2-M8 TaxID=3064706 RepID=UPI0027245BED|nr:methylated-DNA--[protein]-cysteine S-methyltransferase [Haliea sp. E1-2-M8]MDO8863375.1 methylated-DNA--[protein]-cysteine S-methyltransferase [Haliea sp. E1-2-M8]
MNRLTIDSPLGPLQLVSDGSHLTAINFPGQYSGEQDSASPDSVLRSARSQLGEYFAGRRQRFELPLAARGTAFQESVWQALAAIPWGEVRSYRDIAYAIGKPSAVRAVGAANGRNPLPIVVPCHRVIGADGSLTGFGGGLPLKVKLLTLEGSYPAS